MRADLFYAMQRRGPVNVCWEWAGSRDPQGYGFFWNGERTVRAHRFAYELATGEPIPPKLVVMHSCDNPPCTNPGHLALGTQRDNLRDAVSKGRAGPVNNRCPSGHEYTPENTRAANKDGTRECRECWRARKRRYRQRKRERESA